MGLPRYGVLVKESKMASFAKQGQLWLVPPS